MLKNVLFEKYYPICKYSDFNYMTDEQIQKLAIWVEQVIKEMETYNMDVISIATRHFQHTVKIWSTNYDKPISYLSRQLLDHNFSVLDYNDIFLINEALYRNKYCKLVSLFVTPKRTMITEKV